jgi:hypothetical protein
MFLFRYLPKMEQFNLKIKLYSDNYEKTWDIHNPIWEVQDLIGVVMSQWPKFINIALFSNTFVYKQRIQLVSFFYLNGVRDETLIVDFIKKVKGPHMEKYRKTIKDLFEYIDKSHDVRDKYFSYNVKFHEYQTLNYIKRTKCT